MRNSKWLTSNAHSLGIQGKDVDSGVPVNKILIPRNSSLPASKTTTCVTHKDNQKTIRVPLLEGESENPDFCSLLGDCVVHIPEGVPKDSKIRIQCIYLENGTISLGAKLENSQAAAYVELQRDRHSDLESLDIWNARLTTSKAKIMDTQQVAEFDENNATFEQLIGRLDGVYAQVGDMVEKSTPPVSAISTVRFLRQLEKEKAALRLVLTRLRKGQNVVDNYQQRNRLSAHQAHVKMAWQRTSQLHRQCRGRAWARCNHR